MGWFSNGVMAVMLFGQPRPASAPERPAAPGIVARCDDYVRVTRSVFTGREGAWFAAGGQRDYLAADTFGPGALSIGGVDPALYLARTCAGQ